MTKLVSLPLVRSALAWEPRAGQLNLSVCLKATFTLEAEPRPSPEQDGTHDDVYWEQTPHASLYSPTDFVPIKPRADVLLVGSAFAPTSGGVDDLTARLTVGELSKALSVVGERQWIPLVSGPKPSAPHSFKRMALRYERAAHRGENVVGCSSADTSRPPPNIDVEGASANTPGFSPVAPAWRHLLRPLAPAAMAWVQRLRSAIVLDAGPRGLFAPPSDAGPAPPELDFTFFNTAPRDQLLSALTPGTPVVLENLHPTLSRLSFRLPAVEPVVFHVDPHTRAPRELAARCDTLWIDTDRRVFVMSWRAVTPVVPTAERSMGWVVCAARRPGELVTYADLAGTPAPQPAARPAERAPAQTIATSALPAAAAAQPPMPFKSAPARKDAATVAIPVYESAPSMIAPFPLAAAGAPSSGPAEEIAGAPWAATPAPLVPRPDANLRSTTDSSTLAELARAYAQVGKAGAAPSVPTPPPPAAAPAAAPAQALASPWRDPDPPPVEPAAAPAPSPAPAVEPVVAPPVGAQVKKGLYGRFR